LSRPIKLLVVTRFLPTPEFHGACTYLHDILLYLRERSWEIECLYLNEAPAGGSLLFAIPDAVKAIVKLECPGNARVFGRLVRFRGLGALLRAKRGGAVATTDGEPKQNGSDRPASERETSFARYRARRFKPDVVMADFAFLAGVLRDRLDGPRPVRAILTHDVLHERVRSFNEAGLRSAWSKWTEERERELLGHADVIVAISEEEARTFRRMNPASQVVVAPMSARVPSSGAGPSAVPGRCLFVGGADAHNVHGLGWFLREVWPQVLARHPPASLHVCGSVGEMVQGEFPNVSFLGHVPDLAPEYACADVCVVPILAGSGIKIKLVEALSHGRACVTTPEGLRGLGFIREGVILAANAQEFAQAVVGILSDPVLRRKLEIQGRRVVAGSLSPEACYGPFVGAVENMLARGEP